MGRGAGGTGWAAPDQWQLRVIFFTTTLLCSRISHWCSALKIFAVPKNASRSKQLASRTPASWRDICFLARGSALRAYWNDTVCVYVCGHFWLSWPNSTRAGVGGSSTRLKMIFMPFLAHSKQLFIFGMVKLPPPTLHGCFKIF